MDGRTFGERLTFRGENLRGDFDLEELEQLHKFLINEISTKFGSPAAVKVLGKALLKLNFDESRSDASNSLPEPEKIENVEPQGLVSLQGRWKRAQAMLVEYDDQWVARGIHLKALQHAVRRRWYARMLTWGPDEDVMVKIEEAPFGAGAMRECFAMKKLSSHATLRDWKRAQNLVAKRYKKTVPCEVYLEDVKLQMDAKMLGDLYNSCRPPKKVDFITASLYEIMTGPMKGLYCVESLIEGEYLKHNSNSGYVEDESGRNTPQAFSHWSYQYTRGEKLVVDIQGVGDLYTDPQIHTRDSEGYGTGNLGPRGMALFFRGHECNGICHQLGLEPFHRCEADVRSSESRRASMSSQRSFGEGTLSGTFTKLSPEAMAALEAKVSAMNQVEQDVAALLSKDWQKQQVAAAAQGEENKQALVHLELAKLHGEAVLLPELHENVTLPDSVHGALFHLYKAAGEGSAIACCILSRAYTGIPPSQNQIKAVIDAARATEGFSFEIDSELACMYARIAADRGVRGAALFLAGQKAEGDGANLSEALAFYKKALTSSESSKEADEEAAALPGAAMASHEIYAAMGKLLLAGGPGLEADAPSAAGYFDKAAETATACGKGKLAAKYYEMQAEAEG